MDNIVSETLLFTALLLFFLLPGYVFLRVFWGSDKGALHTNNFYSYILWAGFVSALLYSGYCLGHNRVCNLLSDEPYQYKFPLHDIWNSLFVKDGHDNPAPILAYGFFGKIVLLNLILDVLALGLGLLFRHYILKWWWDIRIFKLNLHNQWFYMLTGRTLVYDRVIKKKRKIDGVIIQVDFLCEVGNKTIIYSGVAQDYKLKSDDTLEYVVLINVARRVMGELYEPRPGQEEEVPVVYPLPGHSMIFKGDEIKNVHINYQEVIYSDFNLEDPQENPEEDTIDDTAEAQTNA